MTDFTADMFTSKFDKPENYAKAKLIDKVEQALDFFKKHTQLHKNGRAYELGIGFIKNHKDPWKRAVELIQSTERMKSRIYLALLLKDSDLSGRYSSSDPISAIELRYLRYRLIKSLRDAGMQNPALDDTHTSILTKMETLANKLELTEELWCHYAAALFSCQVFSPSSNRWFAPVLKLSSESAERERCSWFYNRWFDEREWIIENVG